MIAPTYEILELQLLGGFNCFFCMHWYMITLIQHTFSWQVGQRTIQFAWFNLWGVHGSAIPYTTPYTTYIPHTIPSMAHTIPYPYTNLRPSVSVFSTAFSLRSTSPVPWAKTVPRPWRFFAMRICRTLPGPRKNIYTYYAIFNQKTGNLWSETHG